MKVYFAGSIRGGRIDANLYEHLIKYIQKTDIVLTEHVGNLGQEFVGVLARALDDKYRRYNH